MADNASSQGAPPWADKRYTTPPPAKGKGAAAADADAGIPGAARYDTPPPGAAPPDPNRERPGWRPAPLGTFLRAVPDEPGFWGGVDRTGLGFLQGNILGPVEQGARWLGHDITGDPRLAAIQQIAQTPEGEVGEYAGALTSVPIRAAEIAAAPIGWAAKYGPRIVRTIGRIAESATAGGLGGAIAQPGDTKSQAEWGAGIGSLFGVPGAAAQWLREPNVQTMTARFLHHLPFAGDIVRAFKAGGLGGFNHFWLNHSVEPIGGRVEETGVAGMAATERQLGAAIERATKGMSFNGADPAAARFTDAAIETAKHNITDGGALRLYTNILHDTVEVPLMKSGGALNAEQFRAVTSNLAAEIRAIDPRTEAGRSVRTALENYRLALFDGATGGDRALYQKARAGWARYARARDAVPIGSEDGLFTPHGLASEIDKHEPLRAPSGRARDRETVRAAQQALLAPTRAARGAARGYPLTQPEDWASRAGAAAAPTLVLPPVTVTAPAYQPSPGQPPTTPSITPGGY